MESIVMHRVLNFVHNNNIDIVEEIFKDKVSNGMLKHLLAKKETYKKDRNDNLRAWLDFIGNLDNENSAIIYQYINSKHKN